MKSESMEEERQSCNTISTQIYFYIFQVETEIQEKTQVGHRYVVRLPGLNYGTRRIRSLGKGLRKLCSLAGLSLGEMVWKQEHWFQEG